jgi:hypothetical protein
MNVGVSKSTQLILHFQEMQKFHLFFNNPLDTLIATRYHKEDQSSMSWRSKHDHTHWIQV